MEKTIRSGDGVTQIKHDLIFLMQNDAWYHTRVHAIAQNRDINSTFKEVLITAFKTIWLKQEKQGTFVRL